MLPSSALPTSFLSRKSRILSSLSVPKDSYTDASPKGSVDDGIRDLISWINSQDGYVTTSSCAGRISVFAEGKKGGGESGEATAVTASGKGGGGRWLFVSHEPVSTEKDVHDLLGVKPWKPSDAQTWKSDAVAEVRFLRFAFEPMILHVLCATLSCARPLLSAAINAGFRESGVQSLKSLQDPSSCPMVGIRTSGGVAMQSIIGFVRDDGEAQATVPEEHLKALLGSGCRRFEGNVKMTERFWKELKETLMLESRKTDQSIWEDVEARRVRKRNEGLKRRDESSKKGSIEASMHDDVFHETDGGLTVFDQLDTVTK